jgi:hypothetical protein
MSDIKLLLDKIELLESRVKRLEMFKEITNKIIQNNKRNFVDLSDKETCKIFFENVRYFYCCFEGEITSETEEWILLTITCYLRKVLVYILNIFPTDENVIDIFELHSKYNNILIDQKKFAKELTQKKLNECYKDIYSFLTKYTDLSKCYYIERIKELSSK